MRNVICEAWWGMVIILAVVSTTVTCRRAFAAAIDPVTIFEEMLSAECDDLQAGVDADYCMIQYTDLEKDGQTVQARVQLTVGCDVPFGSEPVMQEAEYLIEARTDSGQFTQFDRIESTYLPAGGVDRYLPMHCNVLSI